MVGGTYRTTLIHRMLELPPDDRPSAGSDAAVAINRLSLNPPEPAGAWMSGSPDDGESDA